MWVEDLNALTRDEPQLAVGRPRDGEAHSYSARAHGACPIRCIPERRLDTVRRLSDPRVQLGPRDAKDSPQRRMHPQRTTVVLHGPVDRVAGQTVSARQRRDVAVFDPAQAALSVDAQSAPSLVEREAGHVALAQPIPDG